MMLFLWIYMRLFVTPYCILLNVYAKIPTPSDPWFMIYYPNGILLGTSLVLVAMHVYWVFYIIKSISYGTAGIAGCSDQHGYFPVLTL